MKSKLRKREQRATTVCHAFDKTGTCLLLLLYPLNTDKFVAFVGPLAARGWNVLSEVPASVTLIWAGKAVEATELYSPKKAFTYQEREPKR